MTRVGWRSSRPRRVAAGDATNRMGRAPHVDADAGGRRGPTNARPSTRLGSTVAVVVRRCRAGTDDVDRRSRPRVDSFAPWPPPAAVRGRPRPPPRPPPRRRPSRTARTRSGRPPPSRSARASITSCAMPRRRRRGCSRPTARSCTCSTRPPAACGSPTTPGPTRSAPTTGSASWSSRSAWACSAGPWRSGASSSPATTRPTRAFTHGPGPDRFVDEVGIRSLVVAPMAADDEVFGALGTFSTAKDAFAAPQVGLVRALADHAALAMANARLIEELARSESALSRQADIERSLRELGTRISGARDPGAVVQNTIDEALRLLGGEGARIDIVDPAVRLLKGLYSAGDEYIAQEDWPEDPDDTLEVGVSGRGGHDGRVGHRRQLPHRPHDRPRPRAGHLRAEQGHRRRHRHAADRRPGPVRRHHHLVDQAGRVRPDRRRAPRDDRRTGRRGARARAPDRGAQPVPRDPRPARRGGARAARDRQPARHPGPGPGPCPPAHRARERPAPGRPAGPPRPPGAAVGRHAVGLPGRLPVHGHARIDAGVGRRAGRDRRPRDPRRAAGRHRRLPRGHPLRALRRGRPGRPRPRAGLGARRAGDRRGRPARRPPGGPPGCRRVRRGRAAADRLPCPASPRSP